MIFAKAKCLVCGAKAPKDEIDFSITGTQSGEQANGEMEQVSFSSKDGIIYWPNSWSGKSVLDFLKVYSIDDPDFDINNTCSRCEDETEARFETPTGVVFERDHVKAFNHLIAELSK